MYMMMPCQGMMPCGPMGFQGGCPMMVILVPVPMGFDPTRGYGPGAPADGGAQPGFPGLPNFPFPGAGLPGLVGAIGGAVGGAAGGVAGGIGSAIGGVAGGIGSAVGGIAGGIGSAVGGIAGGIGSAVGGIAGAGAKAGQQAAGNVLAGVHNTLGQLQDVMSAGIDAAKKERDQLLNAKKQAGRAVSKELNDAVKFAEEKVKSLEDGAKNLGNAAGHVLNSIFGGNK